MGIFNKLKRAATRAARKTAKGVTTSLRGRAGRLLTRAARVGTVAAATALTGPKGAILVDRVGREIAR